MKACFQEWPGKQQKDYAQHNQVFIALQVSPKGITPVIPFA